MKGWTVERRARQAAAIRNWRPWNRSTGPRSVAGKARVAQNAWKGGQRPRWRAMLKELGAELGAQRDFLGELSDLASSASECSARRCSSPTARRRRPLS